MGKKKRNSDSSSSDSSDSNSQSDGSSIKETDKNRKKKSAKHSNSSYSDESDHEKGKERKSSKAGKREGDHGDSHEKIKKHKYDDVQKSKWDSPAENISKFRNRNNDREPRKQHDRRMNDRPRNDTRRDWNRNRNNDYRDNRHRDRGGRYDRRQDDRRRSRDRSRSREDNRKDKRDDYNNRQQKKGKYENEDNETYEWGKKNKDDDKKPTGDKEKPNFGLSGKLTEDTNTYRGVVIKYSEPLEARKPKRRWRLYPFKGEKALPTLYIHRESAYLMGRDRKVVDFPLDHPSCSKQHAVLQYRLVPFTRDNGSVGKRVRPYLIDLDSANGTFINNKRIEARKYVELLEKDVIKFGYSTREYVLLHENSKDEGLDDDVKPEDEDVPIKEEPQE